MPSRRSPARGADRRLRGALLLRTGPASRPDEGRLPRYTWWDAYEALRGKLDELGRRLGGSYRVLVDANQHVDREGAARAGVGFYGKNTMLITKRFGSWVVLGTLVTEVELEPTLAARARLRLVHALHRGLPDRRAGRAGRARLHALSLVLDAGAGGDPRALSRGARRSGLRLRHLPGRLPVEPRDRAAPRRRDAARGGRAGGLACAWLEATDAELRSRYERLYFPRKDPRYLRRNALVAVGNSGDPSSPLAAGYSESDDELLREHARWALERLGGGASGSVRGRGGPREALRSLPFERALAQRRPPMRVSRTEWSQEPRARGRDPASSGEGSCRPQQVRNVACLPGIVKASYAMPDIHWGYGFPIGGVAAFGVDDGIISPGGVGYDIACGVRLLRSRRPASKMPATACRRCCRSSRVRFPPARGGVEGSTRPSPSSATSCATVRAGPSSAASERAPTSSARKTAGALEGAEPDSVSERAFVRGQATIGSLGAGNHFLEVQEVAELRDEQAARQFGLEPGCLAVMIHCGSRGLGHQVCTDHLREMERAASRSASSCPTVSSPAPPSPARRVSATTAPWWPPRTSPAQTDR